MEICKVLFHKGRRFLALPFLVESGVVTTVSNLYSHTYLPIEDIITSVKCSLVPGEFLALTLNLKVKDLNNTANVRASPNNSKQGR